ncbi:Terminase small subunit [anaerobic digester metagenome]
MPDKRIDEAYGLFKSGMSLKDIAEECGVSPSTVRSWKSRYKWADKDPPKRGSQSATQHKAQRNTKRSATKEATQSIANMLQPLLDNDGLTEQQKLFCIYFVKSFNATKSYQKAFGCTYESALTAGPRMLGNVRIKLEIARLKREKAMRAYLEPGDIFEEYIKIAFSDLGDYTEWGQEFEATGSYTDKKTGEEVVVGRMVNVVKLKDTSEVDTSVVAEVKQGKNGTSIKLHDKMRALEWLADHLDMATGEQLKRMELMAAQIKKVQAEIKRTEGDDAELSKLDQLLGGLDDQTYE